MYQKLSVPNVMVRNRFYNSQGTATRKCLK